MTRFKGMRRQSMVLPRVLKGHHIGSNDEGQHVRVS
jgi:hypothetical protein